MGPLGKKAKKKKLTKMAKRWEHLYQDDLDESWATARNIAALGALGVLGIAGIKGIKGWARRREAKKQWRAYTAAGGGRMPHTPRAMKALERKLDRQPGASDPAVMKARRDLARKTYIEQHEIPLRAKKMGDMFAYLRGWEGIRVGGARQRFHSGEEADKAGWIVENVIKYVFVKGTFEQVAGEDAEAEAAARDELETLQQHIAALNDELRAASGARFVGIPPNVEMVQGTGTIGLRRHIENARKKAKRRRQTVIPEREKQNYISSLRDDIHRDQAAVDAITGQLMAYEPMSPRERRIRQPIVLGGRSHLAKPFLRYLERLGRTDREFEDIGHARRLLRAMRFL